jgi:hypothetical protein
VRRAGPTWFVPNCSSYPSCVKEGGIAIIPALFMRISSRVFSERNFSAAFLTEEREERSISRKSMLAFGTLVLISAIAAVAFSLLREPMYILEGLCFTSSRIVSFPKPTLPPVMSRTFPARSGMSRSGLKDALEPNGKTILKCEKTSNGKCLLVVHCRIRAAPGVM